MMYDAFDNAHSDEIAALLAVASEGSFVAAGRLLQRHPTVVSKRVAVMEARLGIRLIARTTRQVRLTDAGIQLTQKLRAAVNLIAEAEQEASAGAAEVRGTLRLALPAAMGRQWLAPLLPAFLEAYPQVSIVADYSERFVDIIAEGFDLAIRMGELHDSRLIAKKLGDHRRILCASPAYIATHGLPADPQALVQHNCLRFSGFASFPEWRLTNGRQQHAVLVSGPMTSNDSEALLAAARAGTGILAAGEWLMSRDIAAGKLVRVLPDWQLDAPGGIYLVRPSARFAAASTLAFKTWIEAKFSTGLPWEVGEG
ncbi:LysR family transcriptional regulator [Pseudogulbenkiania subflava]|uniref:DNA-binding transcriptional regulator, LysR family n=1 Tax=Pseudogulbenkiania subflava DSM 22618 TaxID=1123014 RepID=A0A1Y6CA82_9NEIS|nr:LysR family transcriptional regulator [Pseudogulbenkiania subflava]SMF44584.1 DNA-binding transcriptional regulator, LysR family [Pseudogulbenkiania subflava DSM 22618]